MTTARDRVTFTALTMFSEHGFAGVSMRDLARELGIQAPSLYSHFPSKDALLAATIAPLLDAVDVLQAAAPGPQASGERKRAWLHEYLALCVRQAPAQRLAATDRSVLSRPDIGERLRNQSSRMIEILRGFGARDEVAAEEVLGLLLWPNIWLAVSPSAEEQEVLINLAARLLADL
jgi:AcrR family transcriptional regulator